MLYTPYIPPPALSCPKLTGSKSKESREGLKIIKVFKMEQPKPGARSKKRTKSLNQSPARKLVRIDSPSKFLGLKAHESPLRLNPMIPSANIEVLIYINIWIDIDR